MLCKIADFYFADGTLAGGRALTDLRLKVTRVFDVVIALDELNPVLMDRNKRKTDVSFTVKRVHTTIKDSENYIDLHDATVPRTGDITLISTNTTAFLANAVLISHELTSYIGKTTTHAYRISGAGIFATTEGATLLTEDGDHITTETGDRILVEH